MNSNINTNKEYELVSLRNYRNELRKCFQELDRLAKNSFGETKEKYKADAEYLRELSRNGDLTSIKNAIANFQAEKDKASNIEVISQGQHERNLIARLTELRR